jgi:hypothetical protein
MLSSVRDALNSTRGRPGLRRGCTAVSTRPASMSWSRCERTVLVCSPTFAAMACTSCGPVPVRSTSRMATRLTPASTLCERRSIGSEVTVYSFPWICSKNNP